MSVNVCKCLVVYCFKKYCHKRKGVCLVCRALTIEDQISLLKGSAFEIVLLRFNMLFNEKTGIWECGSLKYCMNDAQRGKSQLSARHKALLSENLGIFFLAF